MNEDTIIVMPLIKEEVDKRKWSGRGNIKYHSISILNQDQAQMISILHRGVRATVQDTQERVWLHLIIDTKHYRVISVNEDPRTFVCVRYKEKHL